MKKIALKTGMKIDFRDNPTDTLHSKYYTIMAEATKTYEFYLNNTKEGEAALEYLRKRNITDDVIRKFRIGLSSHKENIISKTLIDEKKFLPIDLNELGLISNVNNQYQDLYHGRIMFPITDLKGNIIAFSGRIYDTESDSKYINSRENEIFKKNQVLFNYANALNDIKLKDQVFIFEGFMDVIAAYRGDINNSIATMGTALTDNQIDIISKLTSNIIICYDGDTPGINAMKRAISLFAKKNISVKAICLPEGLDPDDYLNKYGKEKFIDLFNNRQISSIDYLYNIAKRLLNPQDPNSIIVFQKEVYGIINSVKNKAIEKYLLDKLSTDINTPFNDLEDHLSKYVQSNNIIDEIRRQNDFDYYPNDFSKKPERKEYNKPKKNIYEEAEKGVIYLSFYDRKACLEVKKRLNADDYINRINRNILYSLYDYYDLAKEMNRDEFIKLLKPIEIDSLNGIINTCCFYSIECLNDFLNYLGKSNAYKEDLYLRKKIEENGPNDSANYIHELAKNKKKLIKIKKQE